MELGKYLVLSTAHVHCATAELLTAWARLPPTDRPVTVATTSYGWFVATSAPADVQTLPNEIAAILAFGRQHGCDYVLLDSDGEQIDALPVFPW